SATRRTRRRRARGSRRCRPRPLPTRATAEIRSPRAPWLSGPADHPLGGASRFPPDNARPSPTRSAERAKRAGRRKRRQDLRGSIIRSRRAQRGATERSSEAGMLAAVSRLSIGLVYDLLGTHPRRPGDPPDVDAEYEPESTVRALEAAIARLG